METDTNLLNMYRERVREDDEKIAALQSRLDAALDALGKLPERAFHEGHSAGVSAGMLALGASIPRRTQRRCLGRSRSQRPTRPRRRLVGLLVKGRGGRRPRRRRGGARCVAQLHA